MNKIKTYAVSIAIALGFGGLSALLTYNYMDIYSVIVKPPLTPPGWLFPVVWILLYTLMGVSSAKVYISSENEHDTEKALKVYFLQLFFNFAWGIIFFRLRLWLFAFVWLVALLTLIVIMIVRFLLVNKTAAYLQIPYALWVTFAGYLNLMIYILN